MVVAKFVSPTFMQRHFTCDKCGTLCYQEWTATKYEHSNGTWQRFEVMRCTCSACTHRTLWLTERQEDGRQIYPIATTAPLPHARLPAICNDDYLEARTILQNSPRGAAALLRLCIQKLLKELGEKGERIDDDIKALVKKGLTPQVQQALDVCRVVGNNAVHPGEIDLQDTPEIAASRARISRYELGVHEPAVATARLIATALKVSLPYLYCEDDDVAALLLSLNDLPKMARKDKARLFAAMLASA